MYVPKVVYLNQIACSENYYPQPSEIYKKEEKLTFLYHLHQ